MKHTKNILKSLLITVMALSLLAVSCKKDEGGSKPTDPQTVVVNAETITGVLTSILVGSLDGSSNPLFDTSSAVEPSNGAVTVNTASGKKVDKDIKTPLTTSIETIASSYAQVITLTSDVANLSSTKKDFTLTMKPANANVTFASDVTDGKIYGYADGAATLKVTISEK